MPSNPRGDTTHEQREWKRLLAHREGEDIAPVIARFTNAGVPYIQLAMALGDFGDALYEAASSGDPDWSLQFGGPLGAALLAAEVSALTAHLTSRASAVRSKATDQLLEVYSAVAVATAIGVSRQKVYDIAKNGFRQTYIEYVSGRKT